MPQSSYCAGQVRRFDRDRYLCALVAPEEARQALFALYAFNLEVARIAEMVSEPLIGHMRLQWWRDAVGGIFAGNPPHHHVALALAGAVDRFRLSRQPFDDLIDGRAFDIAGEAPADLDALLAYAAATSATLTGLALEILEARGEAARNAGRDIAIAWALTGLLRAVPFHAGARRIYLPAALCHDAGLEAKDLFAGRPGDGLTNVVSRLADCARDRLAAARRQRPDVPKQALPALLPAVLADGYLKRLAAAGFDPFQARVQGAGALSLLRLGANALRGTY